MQIEGDPDSPISRGRLCPKGAGLQRTQLERTARRGSSTAAPAPRLGAPRPRHGDGHDRRPRHHDPPRDLGGGDERRHAANRTRGFGLLGGATLDNEENYLIKKLFTALGAIQIENQARI